MKPEESREYTARLEVAALYLLKHAIYKKPADLARRFDLPVPVVRYWWRNTEQDIEPINQSTASPNEVKQIRKATQMLESWEKTKRYRPQCGAKLANGKRCKRSVAIRPPEGWALGCLAERCRVHGGFARRIIRKKDEDA
jgi:transposase-like protein